MFGKGVVYTEAKAGCKLRNPINAVKGKIDGDSAEFRGAPESIRTGSKQIDSRYATCQTVPLGRRLHYVRPIGRACSRD